MPTEYVAPSVAGDISSDVTVSPDTICQGPWYTGVDVMSL